MKAESMIAQCMYCIVKPNNDQPLQKTEKIAANISSNPA